MEGDGGDGAGNAFDGHRLFYFVRISQHVHFPWAGLHKQVATGAKRRQGEGFSKKVNLQVHHPSSMKGSTVGDQRMIPYRCTDFSAEFPLCPGGSLPDADRHSEGDEQTVAVQGAMRILRFDPSCLSGTSVPFF